MDGLNPFSNENTQKREHGDESPCVGLQSQTRDEHHGDQAVNRGDTGVTPVFLRKKYTCNASQRPSRKGLFNNT